MLFLLLLIAKVNIVYLNKIKKVVNEIINMIIEMIIQKELIIQQATEVVLYASPLQFFWA